MDARLQALDESLEVSGLPDREFLFNVEGYAWAILQRLRAELFERRLGMPKSDAEVFSILQAAAVIDVVEARRLRQFCEARSLASRDFRKIDVAGVREMAADRGWVRTILGRLGSV